ncbi:hypothetical protein PPTG_01637 [Phytophthora nicotianae INRA-310]|uniref:Uncharacterized protein n=4 Tax=Phytophthora nicotianae TaxID=4792 RepID=W2RA95_PHYN3|nr:hypothetical protein PPTG_01637 [Phytophthora nicotianae INRA-310]ETN21470.1 hypothetical protein PPTG_01637 [Phytophthora nicotianae INRA-310]
MGKLRVNEGNNVKSGFGEDEIGELRKYIVDMMQAEMELMENIKLNERNVAAANARIKYFKELISQERARYKTLRRELEGDTVELKSLEEKQVVAEAKHREFRDAVAKRESEVQVLRTRFQQQRAAMLSLRCQVLSATSNLDKLSSIHASVEKETQNVTVALEECAEPVEQRTARQKLRAKIKYTQRFVVQMEEETNQLAEKRAKLEAEVLKCEQEADKLRESIFLKEKEVEVLFNRLRADTLHVVKENGKIEGKLKAKRRNFRVKTKNEINSLKRRVTFVTSELERGQMTNEDALSSIDALSTRREGLEQRLNGQNEQIAAVETAITELQASIATFGRNEEGFDTTRLQEELNIKREDAQVAQKKLEEKQNLLELLEADQNQLDATLKDVEAHIVAAKDTTERLDREIVSLAKDINDQEAKSRSLSASAADAKKKSDDLQAECQKQQRKNKISAKTQAKLRRQKNSLFKQEKELASEIQEAERLCRILGEGIKYGMECVERLRESNALCDDKEKRIEFELRRQELSLQQQCAQEESKFQADVASWDEKIKDVERQLRSL